ncbi:2-isopropylmalate synthase [Fructobacillus ficulneus]|uniref:2-isopropylmalate synthase n=1 Tax=Fructobacillus ficulneus TaxID=157463 RepID=A0A0K8MIB0_9LACO|nr:2-isopropylmalate synthase [Fructobacillus ficulneus]GAO99599.1 2-isopropylmalate synthase [Fructobacillus ficulneus]
MKNKIRMYDTTLRDGEQTIGANFSVAEKVQIAQALEDYGIDAIEAGFPAASEKDFAAVQAISRQIKKATVVGLARMVRKDIDAAVESTKEAAHQAVHVFIATSPIHRESKLKMTKEEVLDKIAADVAYTKQYVDDIIFSPEDATRTETDFLIESVQTAIDAGATTINIPDTVGYTTPEEFGQIFDDLRQGIPQFDQISWSTHTHNDLGMANANALAGIEHGANEIQGTINGIGERAGNVDLIEAAVAIYVRHDKIARPTTIDLKQSKKISNLVARLSKVATAANKPITGRNAFAHESGIHQDGYLKNPNTYQIIAPEMVGAHVSLPLGKLSGSHAVHDKLVDLGYEVHSAEMPAIFKAFKRVAEGTSVVSDKQMEAVADMVIKEKVAQG